MVKSFMILIFVVVFYSCSKNEDQSDDTNWCPATTATPSNLSPEIDPETAVPIHSNGANSTFFIQLKGNLNDTYDRDVYDVDLFDTSASKITELKNSGKKVICYFSAGSSEDWRSDYDQFNAHDMGNPLDGWEGERWLDVRSENVLDIMTARLDLAVEKGCDGVDPDNMDGHTQDSCFDISGDEQLAYNKKIANLARERGLSVGLKNDPSQVENLEPYFDFSVNEQCHEYDECEMFAPFVENNKPVFNLEYDESHRSASGRNSLCTNAASLNLRTLVMDPLLEDDYVYFCD